MVLGKLIEKSVDGDTAAFLAGADDIGALDRGLGVGLLRVLGLGVDLELDDFTGGLATGGTKVIDMQQRRHESDGRQRQIDD